MVTFDTDPIPYDEELYSKRLTRASLCMPFNSRVLEAFYHRGEIVISYERAETDTLECHMFVFAPDLAVIPFPVAHICTIRLEDRTCIHVTELREAHNYPKEIEAIPNIL